MFDYLEMASTLLMAYSYQLRPIVLACDQL